MPTWLSLALLLSINTAWAGEITPDPQVKGAFLFKYYAKLSHGTSDEKLICDEGRSLANADYEIPVSVRAAAFEACRRKLPKFEVPGYVNLSFQLTDISGVQIYAPVFADLKTSYTNAHSNVPKVYFIISILQNWDALILASSELPKLQAAGFELVFARTFTSKDLLNVIADENTYGIMLDSHGQDPMPITGWFGGYWIDSEGEMLPPQKITRVSSHLMFFSALACSGEYREKQYRRALQIGDGFHFISGIHSKNVIDFYFRADTSMPYAPKGVWVGNESAELDVASAKSVADKNFAQQVERLLRAGRN